MAAVADMPPPVKDAAPDGVKTDQPPPENENSGAFDQKAASRKLRMYFLAVLVDLVGLAITLPIIPFLARRLGGSGLCSLTTTADKLLN